MLGVEELREQRPSEPGFARVLLITAAVLWLAVTGHLYTPATTAYAVWTSSPCCCRWSS